MNPALGSMEGQGASGGLAGRVRQGGNPERGGPQLLNARRREFHLSRLGEDRGRLPQRTPLGPNHRTVVEHDGAGIADRYDPCTRGENRSAALTAQERLVRGLGTPASVGILAA